MSETRYVTEVSYAPNLKASERILANATIKKVPYEVSDEQLTEEVEVAALAKVDELIDQIDSLAKARVFLKRLCKRLVSKGYLP